MRQERKTLIMQVNFHQYLHYSKRRLPDDATYMLLTPKEGLLSNTSPSTQPQVFQRGCMTNQ